MKVEKTTATKANRLGLDCDYVSPDECGFRGTSSCCRYNKQGRIEPMTTTTRDRNKYRIIEGVSQVLQEWFPGVSSDPIAWAFGEAVVERIAWIEEDTKAAEGSTAASDTDQVVVPFELLPESSTPLYKTINGVVYVRIDVDPCLEKRGHDEPMFILLGRDAAAPAAMERWAARRIEQINCRQRPNNAEQNAHIDAVFKKIAEFEMWYKEHCTGRYIPRIRPAAAANLPSGVTWRYVEAPTMRGLYKGSDLPTSKHRYGVIETSPALTKEQCLDFDLTPV